MTIRLAESDRDIERCFPVMAQLRAHLEEAAFVGTVRRQMASGFALAFLEHEGRVRAVAGFRVVENLFAGRILYVDDLVTDEAARSQGYGKTLFDWLTARARAEGCRHLELDSGVQRCDAHRFYLVNRMHIASYHFRLKI